MIQLLVHPLTLSRQPVVSFSVFLFVSGRVYWLGEGDGGRQGAKSYDREKVCHSINHSTVSVESYIFLAWYHPHCGNETSIEVEGLLLSFSFFCGIINLLPDDPNAMTTFSNSI
jgi:hypothetical protein